MPRRLTVKLTCLLLCFELLWTFNLASGVFMPTVTEGTFPRDYFEATPLIEMGSIHGVSYTAEEAVSRLNEKLHPAFELSFVALIMSAGAFVTSIKSKKQKRDIAIRISRRIIIGLSFASIILVIFAIITLS